MPRFLCALHCELHSLQSAGCSAGRARSSSQPGSPHQFRARAQHIYSLQSQRPTLAPASSGLHTGISIEGSKADHNFGNSCRKLILLLEAAQCHGAFLPQAKQRGAEQLHVQTVISLTGKTGLEPVRPYSRKGAPGDLVLHFLVPRTVTSAWGEDMQNTGCLMW